MITEETAQSTPADMRWLARHPWAKAALTVADQGVVSAANFATSIVIGRACSPDEFGLYMLGFTLVLFAVNSQHSLITSPYIVFLPRKSAEERARYSGSILVHQLVLAAVFMFLLGGAGGALASGYGPAGLDQVILTLSAVIVFILLKELSRQICFAGLRPLTALALDAGVSTVQVGGLVLLAWSGVLTAQRAFLVAGGGAFLAAGGWFLFHAGMFAPRRAEVWPDLHANWRFAKWIFATNLAYAASTQIYPWLLTVFHGTEATGIYAACAAIVLLSNPFLLGMSNFLGPKAAHTYTAHGTAGMNSVVRKASFFFAVTMGLFCVGCAVAGGKLLVLFYGGKYPDTGANVLVIVLLACSQLAWSLAIPVNFGLNAMERPDVAFKSLLLATACTLTLGVAAVWAWGPAGVSAGLLIGNSVACAFTRFVYRREIVRAGGSVWTTPR